MSDQTVNCLNYNLASETTFVKFLNAENHSDSHADFMQKPAVGESVHRRYDDALTAGALCQAWPFESSINTLVLVHT